MEHVTSTSKNRNTCTEVWTGDGWLDGRSDWSMQLVTEGADKNDTQWIAINKNETIRVENTFLWSSSADWVFWAIRKDERNVETVRQSIPKGYILSSFAWVLERRGCDAETWEHVLRDGAHVPSPVTHDQDCRNSTQALACWHAYLC